jgi:predicted DNA-binding transcriptional regulator AlpA
MTAVFFFAILETPASGFHWRASTLPNGVFDGYARKRLVTFRWLKENGYVIYSRQHWDRLQAAGEVPKRIQLGKCRVAWFLEEIEEWIETRRRLSRPLRST